MTLKQKMATFEKAYNAYKNIDTAEDLKRNKITLYEYREIFEALKELSRININPIVWCMSEGIANWFKRHGFKVEDPDPGAVEANPMRINYCIGF